MRKVFIFGIANSGKTTLFNGLTGANERTGNWFGVTTEEKCGYIKSEKNKKTLVYDLPGSYLDDYTLEGEVAVNVLKNKITGGAAIVLCEAASLEKGLALLKKIAMFTTKAALVINFYGELLRRGGRIDLKRLKSITGCEVIVAEVNEKRGVSAVNRLIDRLFEKDECYPNDNGSAGARIAALKNADVKGIAEKVCYLPRTKLCAADKFLLNKPIFACVLFFALFSVCLYLSFGEYGIGKALGCGLDFFIKNAVKNPVNGLLEKAGVSPFLNAFVCDGAIGSVCSLVSFLPPLIVLQAFMVFAEESGILARLAFLFDGAFSFAGLTGRAIFTFLTGYGCTAAAAFCAGGLENKKAVNRAIVAIPFVPCSAKIPVYLYIVSVFGGGRAFETILFFYAAGFALAILFAFFNKKIKKESVGELIVEFPPYRLPALKTVAKSLQKFAKSFIIKIGLTVFTVTMCFWLVGSITPSGAFTKNVSESVLCLAGKKISFVFSPIGIEDWRFSLAAIAGIFAKESVASVLIACGGGAEALNGIQIISYLVFFSIYSPCLTALAAIKKSSGLKYALHSFFCQNTVALALCYITYYLLSALKSIV